MQRKITRDGQKNVVIMAWGRVDPGSRRIEEPLIHPSDVQNCHQFKIDQITFTIESGVKVRIAWENDGTILPLEGRGVLNFEVYDSLRADTPDQGLRIEAEGSGCFHLVFDLTKQN